ncbi:g4973 [Coccomyxa elongata]
MEEKRVVIKCVDMREDLQREAIQSATEAMDLHTVEKDIAAAIKKHFDDKYKPTWHCIVGKNFGSYVTHESSHFIYFYIGPQAVLLFKSG